MPRWQGPTYHMESTAYPTQYPPTCCLQISWRVFLPRVSLTKKLPPYIHSARPSNLFDFSALRIDDISKSRSYSLRTAVNCPTTGACKSYEGPRDILTYSSKTWAGYLSRYSDWLRAGRCGNRIPVGARFSTPVQTGPGDHPASCTTGTGYFPGVKRPGRCAGHPPLLVQRSSMRRAILLPPL
jgi:hypothetical protein